MAQVDINFSGSEADVQLLADALAEARRTGDARLVGNWLCDAVDPASGSLLKVKSQDMTEWRSI